MTAMAISLCGLLPLVQAGRPPDPELRIKRTQAMLHYRAGLGHLGSEHFEKAEQEFRAAVALDPLLALGHYGLGQACMGRKGYLDAIGAYRGAKQAYLELAALRQSRELEASERREDSVRDLRDAVRELQVQLSRVRSESERVRLQLRIQSLEAGIDGLERLRGLGLGADVVPAEFSLALGSAHFRAGQLVEAEVEYREALKVNPKYGEVHNNLAVICMMSGRLDEAADHVKAAEKAGVKVHSELKADLSRRRAGK